MSTVATAAALLYTRSVVIPFVLAVFFTYMASPLVDILRLRLQVRGQNSTTHRDFDDNLNA